MGNYLNPGSGRYETALRGEIYVDKTGMIALLNAVISTPQRYVCVSRPRRFGKTMAADMIAAYYDRSIDCRNLFEGKAIARERNWDACLGRFDVIRLVMTDFMRKTDTAAEMRERLEKAVLRDLTRQYPDVDYLDPGDLQLSMQDIYSEKKRTFVIIIDEWDAVFREWPEKHEDHQEYLNFLRDWLKDQEYVALAYMTGILPIRKYGAHSALNMFREFSMVSPGPMAQYTGFTDDEVRKICEERNLNFNGFRNWYDGYRLAEYTREAQLTERAAEEPADSVYEIYSPLSVVYAALNRSLGNYWNQTETFEALKVYIDRNYDGLKETIAILINSGRAHVDISTYQNDMTTFHNKDDVLTLLIHLGYLGYDSCTEEVFIPNKEVLDVFRSSTKSQEWSASFKALEESQELLEATWAGDAEKVAYLLELAHEQAGTKAYHSEAAFSYAVQLAYYSARNYYTKVLELASGKGYADLVYLPSPEFPDKPALLVELKYNQSSGAAIEQIHRQHYPQVLEKYKGNILLVAVNYDRDASSVSKEFKHHSCVIEHA